MSSQLTSRVYPDRPYIVLGYLDVTTRRRGEPVAFAAQRAKELGADAIIVKEQGQKYASNSGSVDAYGNFYSHAKFRGKAQVLAIKWK